MWTGRLEAIKGLAVVTHHILPLEGQEELPTLLVVVLGRHTLRNPHQLLLGRGWLGRKGQQFVLGRALGFDHQEVRNLGHLILIQNKISRTRRSLTSDGRGWGSSRTPSLSKT